MIKTLTLTLTLIKAIIIVRQLEERKLQLRKQVLEKQLLMLCKKKRGTQHKQVKLVKLSQATDTGYQKLRKKVQSTVENEDIVAKYVG